MTSKYDRLGDHLDAIGAATIALTFAEIEAIVGPLSPAARHTSQWWGASEVARFQNPYAMYWWRAGYVADRPDLVAEVVTFRRVAPVRSPRQ